MSRLTPVCFNCGEEMEPKGDTEFWMCPNCNYNSEADFDAAVLRGFEIGIDLIKEVSK